MTTIYGLSAAKSAPIPVSCCGRALFVQGPADGFAVAQGLKKWAICLFPDAVTFQWTAVKILYSRSMRIPC